MTHTIVTISAKTHIVCSSMNIEKKMKFKDYLYYWKIFTGAINQQRKLQINKNYIPSYSPGYGKFENLFHFCGLNSEYVTCVYLQCSRHKQNRYYFLGRTTTIDKCAVSLRVISMAYLIGQSLVNILSQISAL